MRLSNQERIHYFRWIGENIYSICSQIVLTKKSLAKVEWDLKGVQILFK